MKKIRLHENWDFVLNGAYQGKVDLPHDFSISQPRSADAASGPDGGYFPGGLGDYNRILTPNPGRRTGLLFDGSFGVTEVYINDNLAAINRYGYNGFFVDLTEYLTEDEDNRLNVRVNNKWQPNARWYTGSGIYRNVMLFATPKTEIRDFHATVDLVNNYRDASVDLDVELGGPRCRAAAW
jgi:beta-galactosidase